MLDLKQPFSARIDGLKLVVRSEGPLENRYLRWKLETVLDAFMADSLGAGAVLAWAKVRDRTLDKVEIAINAIRAKVILTGSRRELTLDQVKGVKLVIVASPEPESEAEEAKDPTVSAEFECKLTDEAMVFLAWNSKSQVEVKFQRQNPELPHVNARPAEPAPAGGLSPKARSAAEARLATLLPFGPVDPAAADLDPAQLAESPEEAEEIRASRRTDDGDPAPATDPPESAEAVGDEGLVF